MQPAAPSSGSSAAIRFRLVRNNDDGSPIYWTAYFLERPAGGGTLSATSGGPVSSGAVVELVYKPAAPTTAAVTIYPASIPGRPNGDGSGDWRSFAIEVPAYPSR